MFWSTLRVDRARKVMKHGILGELIGPSASSNLTDGESAQRESGKLRAALRHDLALGRDSGIRLRFF